MKKLFLYVFVVLVSLVILRLYSYEKKLGDGSYFLYDSGYTELRSFDNQNIHIADVVYVKYNNKYIIAIRIF